MTKKPNKKLSPAEEKERRRKEVQYLIKNRKNLQKELDKEKAIPFGEMILMMKRIGYERVSYDLKFPIHFTQSWKTYALGDRKNGWKPQGEMMIQLQDYLKQPEFKKHRC